jgi:hypothetical protein
VYIYALFTYPEEETYYPAETASAEAATTARVVNCMLTLAVMERLLLLIAAKTERM